MIERTVLSIEWEGETSKGKYKASKLEPLLKKVKKRAK